VWYQDGKRRQCESVTEDGLAARLEKVRVRLEADAPGLEAPGAELVRVSCGRSAQRGDSRAVPAQRVARDRAPRPGPTLPGDRQLRWCQSCRSMRYAAGKPNDRYL
jgi:hypothetical protein